jgi:hypothetical protein
VGMGDLPDGQRLGEVPQQVLAASCVIEADDRCSRECCAAVAVKEMVIRGQRTGLGHADDVKYSTDPDHAVLGANSPESIRHESSNRKEVTIAGRRNARHP